MIREAIDKLVGGNSLTQEEASQVMEEIMSGQATPAQFAAFVTALRLKGETVDEIAGLASVMRAKALPVDYPEPLVDTCGTGGDRSGTFNISTTAAFVVAACGLKVAKHGNRAMTSHAGSADVLEALGVKIDLGPDGVRQCLDRAGIGFMFAPIFHPAMKFAASPRREIGIMTVFNILGPLTNPARVKAQVVGVARRDLVLKMARALERLGCRHALVVHGHGGLDEIALSGATILCEIKKGNVQATMFVPEDVGLTRVDQRAILGGTAAENATYLRQVLTGVPGPRQDVVLLNAAAGLLVGDKVTTMKEGVMGAREAIASGRALEKLEALIRVSQEVGDKA